MKLLRVQAYLGGTVGNDGALTETVLVLNVTDENEKPVVGIKKQHVSVGDASMTISSVEVTDCTDLSTVPDFSLLKGVYHVPIGVNMPLVRCNFVLVVKIRMPAGPNVHKTVEGQTLVWSIK